MFCIRLTLTFITTCSIRSAKNMKLLFHELVTNHNFNFPFQDLNDIAPEFEQTSYTAEGLYEDVAVGTNVLKVSASDGDPSGSNSDIRFSISAVQPSSGGNLFYISPADGQISVSRPLTQDDATSRYVVSGVGVMMVM